MNTVDSCLSSHMRHKEREQIVSWFRNLQDRVCLLLESHETSQDTFIEKEWPYSSGEGGGISRVLRGNVFEKAGVNTSCISGLCNAQMAQQLQIDCADAMPPFWASGISLIVHPLNPFMPSIHFNTRCFVLEDRQWFGGCTDLTPMLEDRCCQEDPDALFFHQQLKEVCLKHWPEEIYALYKEQCDRYFFLPHRQKPRGIGGIYYDHVHNNWERDFAFTQALGERFLLIYAELINRNKHKTWGEQERQAQLQRRALYVEFNLLYDRGTHFGLKSGGNIEAIFSSMPPLVCW